MGKRMTKAERAIAIARNTARLEEVNDFLRGIDLDIWDVQDAKSFSGYIFGVWMTHRPTNCTIVGTSGAEVARIEAQQTAWWLWGQISEEVNA